MFYSLFSMAQQNKISVQNLRTKTLAVSDKTIRLDSLSIVPGSFVSSLDSTSYLIDYAGAKLIWKTKPTQDSISISYRVFPFYFAKRYAHKNRALNYDTNFVMQPFSYSSADINNEGPFVDYGNIDYSGAFGRALSFGNNQDVVLNSQFNLQLECDLGDSIKIRCAITDNTIPFKPEGNTQNNRNQSRSGNSSNRNRNRNQKNRRNSNSRNRK